MFSGSPGSVIAFPGEPPRFHPPFHCSPDSGLIALTFDGDCLTVGKFGARSRPRKTERKRGIGRGICMIEDKQNLKSVVYQAANLHFEVPAPDSSTSDRRSRWTEQALRKTSGRIILVTLIGKGHERSDQDRLTLPERMLHQRRLATCEAR